MLKVVVVVNAVRAEIEAYLKAGIDVVQLHGDESESFAKSLAVPVWRALRLSSESQIGQNADFPCDMFVIDSYVKDSAIPGGTGHVGDWGLSARFVEQIGVPVLLAGGIDIGNAQQALDRVKSFGLDLSSGVEISPGKKDHSKIKELFTSLKRGK